MDRALREFRIRGVSTNIAFVENLLKHPTLPRQQLHHPVHRQRRRSCSSSRERRDRATQILTYIADITVNGHPETAGRPRPHADARSRRAAPRREPEAPPPGTRQLLDSEGPARPSPTGCWRRSSVLVTDTTMRDAHQSLLATRMRSLRHDPRSRRPMRSQPAAAVLASRCWGGATFDVAYRFLQECPWQRLRDIRAQRCPTS